MVWFAMMLGIWCREMLKCLREWRLILKGLLVELRMIIELMRFRKPSQVFLKVFFGDDGMLKGQLLLPVADAKAQVLSRELIVKNGSNDPVTLTLEASTVTSPDFAVAVGDVVTGSLSDVNKLGKSEASEFSFTVALPDPTSVPAKPGEVTFNIVEV